MNWKKVLRQLLMSGVALFSTAAISAQVVPAYRAPNESLSVGGMVSSYHLDYGKRWLAGGGVFVDANLYTHWGVEGEAMWLRVNQEANTHADTYLLGPRYTYWRGGRWRPYAKLLVGDGHFNYPYNYASGNYFVIAPGGGVDYRLSRKWQVRVVDVEFQRWTHFPYGSPSNYGISSGLRYRIF